MTKASFALGTTLGVLLVLSSASAVSADSILDKLYKMIWPLGHFNGDLASAVARNSEKAGAPSSPRLYVVDPQNRTWVELPSARGSADAVACPDGQQIFYRRKTNVVQQSLKPSVAKPDAATPTTIDGVASSRLFACVEDGSSGVALWAETTDGKVQVLRYQGTRWTWTNPPADLGNATEAAERLSLMRAARPDGTVASVRDRQLFQQPRKKPDSVVIENASVPPFHGIPQWLGSSNRILVAGSGTKP